MSFVALLGFLNLPVLYCFAGSLRQAAGTGRQALTISGLYASSAAIPIRSRNPVPRISGVLLSFCGAVVIAFRGTSHHAFCRACGCTLALCIYYYLGFIFGCSVSGNKRDEVVKAFLDLRLASCMCHLYVCGHGSGCFSFACPGVLPMWAVLDWGYFYPVADGLEKAPSTARLPTLFF